MGSEDRTEQSRALLMTRSPRYESEYVCCVCLHVCWGIIGSMCTHIQNALTDNQSQLSHITHQMHTLKNTTASRLVCNVKVAHSDYLAENYHPTLWSISAP